MGFGLGIGSKVESVAQRLLPYLPRQFSLAPPVCQVYINDGRSTRFTLLNFPSIYSPEVSNSYYYELNAYRHDGSFAGRETIDLDDRCSCDFGIDEMEFFPRLSEWGLFSAQLRPRKRMGYKDQHLGRLTSQFYALYHSTNWESLALVHPQSTISVSSAPTMTWSSGRLIDLSNLASVEIFQINPSSSAVRSKLVLKDAYGNSYIGSDETIPSLGTRRIVWLTEALPADRLVHLAAEGMTCANGKPLVFCHFRNGAFSGSHT